MGSSLTRTISGRERSDLREMEGEVELTFVFLVRFFLRKSSFVDQLHSEIVVGVQEGLWEVCRGGGRRGGGCEDGESYVWRGGGGEVGLES